MAEGLGAMWTGRPVAGWRSCRGRREEGVSAIVWGRCSRRLCIFTLLNWLYRRSYRRARKIFSTFINTRPRRGSFLCRRFDHLNSEILVQKAVIIPILLMGE